MNNYEATNDNWWSVVTQLSDGCLLPTIGKANHGQQ